VGRKARRCYTVANARESAFFQISLGLVKPTVYAFHDNGSSSFIGLAIRNKARLYNKFVFASFKLAGAIMVNAFFDRTQREQEMKAIFTLICCDDEKMLAVRRAV
jgi:hypothetical protein